jgi:hypothetical protein
MDGKKLAPLAAFLLLVPPIDRFFNRFNREFFEAVGQVADMLGEHSGITIGLVAMFLWLWTKH